MARYTGGRAKLSRRVNRNLFLKGVRSYSAKDEYNKRPFKPTKSKSRRPGTLSEYGKQLLEKQALKYTYGVLEKQLSNLFKKAFKKKGDTGENALSMLEKRIDNVIYKGGLANSRAQARQLVNHGHFSINGGKVQTPSYQVKTGDVIKVKNNKVKKPFWEKFKLEVPQESPTWLQKSGDYEIKIISDPLKDDLPISEFNIPSIVELYSNKVA